MTEAEAAKRLTALSHETRLRIFRTLISKGPEGLPAGQLAEALDVAPSNLSAHLNTLNQAGLVLVRRTGRHRFYTVDIDAVAATIGFLVADCCGGHPDICSPILETLRPAC